MCPNAMVDQVGLADAEAARQRGEVVVGRGGVAVAVAAALVVVAVMAVRKARVSVLGPALVVVLTALTGYLAWH